MSGRCTKIVQYCFAAGTVGFAAGAVTVVVAAHANAIIIDAKKMQAEIESTELSAYTEKHDPWLARLRAREARQQCYAKALYKHTR